MRFFERTIIVDEEGKELLKREAEITAEDVVRRVWTPGFELQSGAIEQVKRGYKKRLKSLDEKKPKAGKKGKGHGCGECGEKGHNRKTCPELSRGRAHVTPESEGPRSAEGAEKTKKIRRMLTEHVPYLEIAKECGTTIQVVSFVAKQMQGRGEL